MHGKNRTDCWDGSNQAVETEQEVSEKDTKTISNYTVSQQVTTYSPRVLSGTY